MLSFPRDLRVEIRCPGKSSYVDKINAAYATCGPRGTVETVSQADRRPDQLHHHGQLPRLPRSSSTRSAASGWTSTAATSTTAAAPAAAATRRSTSSPGTSACHGLRALDFVRFRHTDSDLYRNARQQLFVRSFKDQIEANFSVLKLPAGDQGRDLERRGRRRAAARTSARRPSCATRRWRTRCRRGHIFQSRIDGLEGFSDLVTAPENIERAVREFKNPDVESPRKATAVALGEKLKQRVPPPRATSVLVLNGNGVEGSASTRELPPRAARVPDAVAGRRSDGERADVRLLPHRRSTSTQRRAGAKPAARKLANLFGSADVKKLTPKIRALGNDAMVVAVIGQTFHGRLAPAPVDQTPKRQPASVVVRSERGRRPAPRAPARDPVPADGADEDRHAPRGSTASCRSGSTGSTATRSTRRCGSRTGMGSNEYWGVQMTDWEDAPVARRPQLRP